MANKSFDGYSLLTPNYLKVKEVTCEDGSSYFEVGASKWKLRLTIESMAKLKAELDKYDFEIEEVEEED